LRALIATQVVIWEGATFPTEKAKHEGHLYGLCHALEVLLTSPEGQNSPQGFPPGENIVLGWKQPLCTYLGENMCQSLGFGLVTVST
jgi:hypothetical protein